MAKELFAGIDVGSVSVNAYVTDENDELLLDWYRRTNGLPFQSALAVLEEIEAKFPGAGIRQIAFTGSGGKELAELVGGHFVNEIVAQARAVEREIPDVRTVIEMGGEDSKLLFFEKEDGQCALKDFSMNALCAAGTGSFLDQQATRLGVSIEKEFGELALKCQLPPRIAGRCSVFAKSDMIHLQQVGTPVQDIVSGLCHALARNFKATIGRGKDIEKPIAFQGGVAANIGMVRAFESVFGLDEDELVIPERFASMGALGALLIAREKALGRDYKGLDPLRAYVNKPYDAQTKLQKLKDALTEKGAPESVVHKPEGEVTVEGYLGIDVGSISTNVVVIDADHRVLSKRYLPTASRPIEAISKGLAGVYEDLGDRVVIKAAGTTGSGRYLSGDLIGADAVCNEITAQATAAIAIDPEVDTIFEIGGQDSKYISIDNGAIVDFEMNKVCAAGTGSFLEEQAERLGIDLKTEFASLALNADHPAQMGDRCTVFMETDLVHYQQAGAEKDDLLAGLAYSTVFNYLNRVVTDKRVGKRIFFQGGTAFNKAVVAAFNKVTEREVIVPPHHEVTGAIGVAIIARQRQGDRPSSFKGFDVSKRKYELETFECKSCENRCEIHMVKTEGEKPLYYGSRCEKFDVDHRKKKSEHPDLFKEREEQLYKTWKKDDPSLEKGTVGIPLASVFYEQLPYWTTFFQELGYRVVMSGPSTKKLINRGVEAVVSETCFPIKVAHGHVLALFDKKPDFIFLPSVINSPMPGYTGRDKNCYNCPYIQTLPYTTNAALNFDQRDVEVFAPPLHMQSGLSYMKTEMAGYADYLKSDKGALFAALDAAQKAQDDFKAFLHVRGREVLSNLDDKSSSIVIVGRPYNTCDDGVNLDLPKKLLGMDILPIPMDMLPLDKIALSKDWGKMYWRYGQRIMKAARFIRETPRLYALYVTNFGCGPDSFLLKYFGRELADKPFLQIEIDEHSADAGAITRCEAYLDTISSYNGSVPEEKRSGCILPLGRHDRASKILIPHMCKQAFAIKAAFESEGFTAEVMEPPDEESVHWGRKYTTGKECYPALLTTGDMVRELKRPGFKPDRTAFFMPSANGPCRFGQYATLHRHVLDDLGYRQVPVISLSQDVGFHSDTGGLSSSAVRKVWLGVTAIDVLDRLLMSTRPYEKNPGETDALYQEVLDKIEKTLREGGDVFRLMSVESERFHELPLAAERGSKPLVGIVGEIYIRASESGNEYLVRTLESMGAETALPPIAEWLDYVTLVRKRYNRRTGRYWTALKDYVIERYMHRVENKLAGLSGVRSEAFPDELIELAKPYLHESFCGEAILSVGKTLEFINKSDAAGVINVMPFTCMPGTIVTALLKRVREDHDGFPCISLAFAGQQSLNLRMRLEAFMYQVTQNWNAGKESPAAAKLP